jgi:hypothetical protein
MLKSLKRIIAIGLFWLAGCVSNIGGTTDSTYLATSEIAWQGPVTVKVKPTYSRKGDKEQSQLELLVGKDFRRGNLKTNLYLDAKSDLEETVWLGLRGGTDYLIGKTHLGFQLRHFSGLNDNSSNHFYYIPYLSQDLTGKLSIGLWDYGKQNYEDEKGFSYLGPFFVYSFNKKSKVLFHYGEDIKENGDLVYLKLDFKF